LTKQQDFFNMRKPLMALALAAALPGLAHAWWNGDWQQRTQVTLNTTAQGVETKQVLAGAVVPVRLHSGNFDFLGAKPDGSDVRVLAADDKTPLKFWVERFDSTNELAVIWVQLPSLLPGSDQNKILVYAGNESAVVEATSPALYDSAVLAAFSFAEKDGPALTHDGRHKTSGAVTREINGMIGASGRLDGQRALIVPVSEKLTAPTGGPYTVSMWIKPEQGGQLFNQAALSLSLEGDTVRVSLGGMRIEGGALPSNAWAHVMVAIGQGKATLYVNGAQAAQGDVPVEAGPFTGDITIGQNWRGLVDQLEVAGTVRSAEWARLAHAAQSADAKLIAAVTQTAETAESAGSGEAGEGGYMGILVSNLTVDAWVVIGILGIMFVISAWVMYVKTVLVGRAEKDNRAFLEGFRGARDVLVVAHDGFDHSSLARMYQAGLRELNKRDVGKANTTALSGASMDAVKAAIDADMVRESHHLNAHMVLLTIAISGGPFLGLLGTVVGVMITFAAIAAAGDVNVNAIAPGIAAALLATVAGLGVAIPALFGYNYLASRIKSISADMQIFVDEFVTRVAETYGAR
jgi:biopolymer transport protein ExbB